MFNLETNPWIPAMTPDGVGRLSLRETLVRAHEVTSLGASTPLIAAALHRFLVALAADALRLDDISARWPCAFDEGRFDHAVLSDYLAEHAHRFELFDTSAPFYQVASLESVSGERRSVGLLLPEVATGNNVPLFSSTTEDDVPALAPAEAAQRLIACHAFDTAAIKTGAKGDPRVTGGKTTGNPTGPAGQLGLCLPLGRNLFETLMLGVAGVGALRAGDVPAWRREPLSAEWTERTATGQLDVLTWQSRRVRLFADEDGNRVRHVVVAAGDRLAVVDPALEPNTAWRQVDAARGGPAHRPRRLQPGRAGWRGMQAMLALDEGGALAAPALERLGELVIDGALPETYPLEVHAVGVVYGNQSAVVEHVFQDVTPFPVRALQRDHGQEMREVLGTMVAVAEEVRAALDVLHGNVRTAAGGSPVPWDKGERPGDRFVSGLGTPAHRMLIGLQREPERVPEAFLAWERTLFSHAHAAASLILDAAPPSAFLGREIRKDFTMRQATAEAVFRAKLRRLLPRAAEDAARGTTAEPVSNETQEDA